MMQNLIVWTVIAAAAVYLFFYFRRSADKKNADQPCAHCVAKKPLKSR